MKQWSEQLGRYFVNAVIYIFVFTCLVFFVFGDYLRLSGYAVSILIVLAPYYIYSRSPKLQRIINKSFIDLLQIFLALVFFTSLLGSLAFYTMPETWWYDTAIHFFNSAVIYCITSVVLILFQDYFFQKSFLIATLAINFLLVIFVSFLWEFYESTVDSLFVQAGMFGQNGEIYLDTLTDLAADLAGGLLATWLIYRYFYAFILKYINHSTKNDHQRHS